jgi:hypothetical protein
VAASTMSLKATKKLKSLMIDWVICKLIRPVVDFYNSSVLHDRE